MSDTFLATNQARRRYTQRITSALKRGFVIEDPDFATVSDEDAWERVRRDAFISHAIMLRMHSIAGPDFTVLPASKAKEDEIVADVIRQLIGNISAFQSARFNLSESALRGDSYAFNLGQRMPFFLEGYGMFNLWVPKQLKHVDRYRFRQVPLFDPQNQNRMIGNRWEFFSLKREQWESITDQERSWFTRNAYLLTEESLGYGRGLLTSIYYYWWAKSVVLEHLLKASERWTGGLLHVGLQGVREASTGKTNDDIVDEWLEILEKSLTQHIVVHDKEDEITLQTGPGEGGQIAFDIIRYLDQALSQLILGSSLMSGGGGETGSLARAQEEAQTFQALIQLDRGLLGEALTSGLVRLVFKRNLGTIRDILQKEGLPMGRMPRIKIVNQKLEDPAANATILQTANQMGLDIKLEEVYERLGLTMPEEDDEVLEGQEASDQPFIPFGSSASEIEKEIQKQLSNFTVVESDGKQFLRIPVDRNGTPNFAAAG